MPATIVDQLGRPLRDRYKSPRGGQYVFPHRGAWWDTLAADITPAMLVSYIKNAERGILAQQAQLFDRMVDRDDRLQAVLETRKLAVTGVEREVQPRVPEDARAEKAADLVREKIAHLDMGDIIGMLLDAVPKGLAVGELVWEGSEIATVNEVPLRMFQWEDGVLKVDVAKGNGKSNYQPLSQNKYVAFSPRTKPGGIERRGILRCLSMLWISKHWSMRDWAAFVEVFGMPLRLGIYPENATAEAKATLYDAVQEIGSDSAAIIQENMRIEFPRAQNGSTGSVVPMEQLANYVDRGYAIRVLGQNTSTEGVSGTGTLAASSHESVRSDYKKADAKGVARAIETQLFAPIVGFNLGWDYPVPKLWFDVEDAQDDESRAKVYTELAKIPGMTFSRSQIYEEFNLREPLDEGDALRVDDGGDDPDPGMGEVNFGQRRGVFSTAGDTKKDVTVTEGALSSGMLASEGVHENLMVDAGQVAVNRMFQYITRLAGDVDTPEQLLRRLKLAAPDLEADLKASGLSMEDVSEIVAQGMMTCHYNGEQAVDNELAVQPDEKE